MRRICGRSSSGRAPPCQGGGSEFEPRRPLQYEAIVDAEMQKRWLFCFALSALSVTYGDRLPLLSPVVTSSPGAGEVFPQRESPWHGDKVSCSGAKLVVSPEPLPLGEVASRSDDGEGEPVPSIAANFTAVPKASPWGSWHGASRD